VKRNYANVHTHALDSRISLQQRCPIPVFLDALGHQVYPFDVFKNGNNCDFVHRAACILSAQTVAFLIYYAPFRDA
jgi:hypothetical protein